MTGRPRLGRVCLVAALAATLAATGWTRFRPPAVDLPAPGAAPVTVRLPAPAPAPVPPGQAAPDERPAPPAIDLFAAATWDLAAPPPPLSAQVAAPAEVQAPPLPFTFFGRTEVVGEAGAMLVHLRAGREVFSVRAGARINEQYRLDKIDAAALDITYLPMDVKQTLVIGPP